MTRTPRVDYPDHTGLIRSARSVSNDELEGYEQGASYADWIFLVRRPASTSTTTSQMRIVQIAEPSGFAYSC